MGQKYAAYNASGAIIGYYDSVDSPVPAGVTAIAITDAQWQECIGVQGDSAYTVVSGALTAPTAPTEEKLLAAAQGAQATLVSNACSNAIYSGFTSSALGHPYQYPAKTTDQQNLASSVIAALLASQSAVAWSAETTYAAGALVSIGGQLLTCVNAGPSGSAAPTLPTAAGQIVNDGTAQWELWTTPFWCESPAGAWAFVAHTAPQILKVGVDGKQAILTNMAKNQALQDQIAAATTVSSVQAITWS